MSEGLLLSLLISAVGMGLVFASIVLLWGVITLIMRFSGPTSTEADDAGEIESAGQASADDRERKRRAALAAVAVALSRDQSTPKNFPLPPTALVSAWQAVQRANHLSKRGNVR